MEPDAETTMTDMDEGSWKGRKLFLSSSSDCNHHEGYGVAITPLSRRRLWNRVDETPVES